MRFDIILPTIGRDSLATAVKSVVDQTYDDWILHVVGDGIDAQHLPEIDPVFDNPRIRCYSMVERHASYGANARNFGISAGESEWIAYIDDDDEWLPLHLATIVNLSSQYPEADMIRTAGQSFKMRHKSPRSSNRVQKLGPVNTTDILTVGMAHTRELFYNTSGWLPCDNHDHKLWRAMLNEGGTAHECEAVTFLFER